MLQKELFDTPKKVTQQKTQTTWTFHGKKFERFLDNNEQENPKIAYCALLMQIFDYKIFTSRSHI